jgi:hypothetical protein
MISFMDTWSIVQSFKIVKFKTNWKTSNDNFYFG